MMPHDRARSRLIALVVSSATSFAIAEIAVRATGTLDADGAFAWRGIQTWPIPLPIARHDELLEPIRASKQPRLVYHEKLGWVPNPIPGAFQGLYHTNDDGIRTDAARARYSAHAPEGVLRIVLLGDSFTYFDELPFESSWGHRLEQALIAAGRPAEVINLGVGGYGMDQALLRFRELGKGLAPDLVIFGLRPENALRNLSIVRLFYRSGSKIPYTKPRFVFDDTGRLRLLNSPALTPEELNQKLHADTLREWSLLEFDLFAAPYLEPKHFWNSSRLLSVVERVAFQGTSEPGTPLLAGSEPFRLALACMRALQTDAQAVGARMIAVHLSTKSRGSEEALVTVARQEFEVLDTSEFLRARLSEVGAPLIRRNGSHYSEETCKIIGEFLAQWTLENGP